MAPETHWCQGPVPISWTMPIPNHHLTLLPPQISFNSLWILCSGVSLSNVQIYSHRNIWPAQGVWLVNLYPYGIWDMLREGWSWQNKTNKTEQNKKTTITNQTNLELSLGSRHFVCRQRCLELAALSQQTTLLAQILPRSYPSRKF